MDAFFNIISKPIFSETGKLSLLLYEYYFPSLNFVIDFACGLFLVIQEALLCFVFSIIIQIMHIAENLESKKSINILKKIYPCSYHSFGSSLEVKFVKFSFK